jgi:(5-formylfuran-3-yl)methyl phosphate synthase
MTALLISVRDREEARLCLAAGVDLIDIKEPGRGPLGQAPVETLAGVLDEVTARRPVSAALGELADWPDGVTPEEVARLHFIKWGLSRCGDGWRDRLARLRDLVEGRSPCKVVLTCYVDAQRAGSPAVDDVCHHAIASRASVLLLDTWGKDGTRLLDWLPAHALERIIRACHDGGVRVALGGSLGRRDIERLLPLRPDWVAVRGAACAGGRRDGPLDPSSVAALVDLIRPTSAG